MSKQLNQRSQSTNSPNTGNAISKRRRDPFPPKLPYWQRIILGFTYLFGVLALVYLVDQFCLGELTPSSVCGTYIAFVVVLSVLLIDRTIRNKITVHKARLVDQSLVAAMMVEAGTVEPRLEKPSKKPDYYEKKVEEINNEVKRLKENGNRSWTEYQILSLNQMLVDFYKVDDLIASTRLSLAELEEYAEDSAYRYDRYRYYDMKQRIEDMIETIENIRKDNYDSKSDHEVERDNASERLRAELRTSVLEHVADYRQNWSEGSALVRALTVLGVISIPILLAMGLLTLLHPNGDSYLHILNWGLLGICGAVTAVLLSMRKSDLVEVGNTEGRKELRNAILGSSLGLIAGVLAYAMISGGLLVPGGVVPKLKSTEPYDVGLSIIWAVASGFSFEKIFDRMRSVTVGES